MKRKARRVAGLLKPKLHRSGRLDNPNPTATADQRKHFLAAVLCGPHSADRLVINRESLILSTLIYDCSLFAPAQAFTPDSQMARCARMRGVLAGFRFVLHTFTVAVRFRVPGVRPRLSFNN